jgi:hypothetical protein
MEARQNVNVALLRLRYSLAPSDLADIETLLAATEPPTDEEIANPAARLVTGIGYGGVRHFPGPVKP